MGGACLGLGIVSARTQTEHDPAYALLYEYVEKVRACPDVTTSWSCHCVCLASTADAERSPKLLRVFWHHETVCLLS